MADAMTDYAQNERRVAHTGNALFRTHARTGFGPDTLRMGDAARASLVTQLTTPALFHTGSSLFAAAPALPSTARAAAYLRALLRFYTARSTTPPRLASRRREQYWTAQFELTKPADPHGLPIVTITAEARMAYDLWHPVLRFEIHPLDAMRSGTAAARLRYQIDRERASIAEIAQHYQVNPRVWLRIPDVVERDRTTAAALVAAMLRALLWPQLLIACAPDTLRLGPVQPGRSAAAHERTARRRTWLPTLSLIAVPVIPDASTLPANTPIGAAQFHLTVDCWREITPLFTFADSVAAPGHALLDPPGTGTTDIRAPRDMHQLSSSDMQRFFLEHADDTDDKLHTLLT